MADDSIIELDRLFDIELDKLGARIRKIRKSRKMTLVDLQLSSGIHDSDLSRIERGLDNIEFFTIFKIAKGLEVQTKDLLDYDGPLPGPSPNQSLAARKRIPRKKRK